MGVDLNKLNYYSGANYMKRYISDKRNVGTSPLNISHPLGHVPQFVYYADLFNDGMLWYGGERVFEGTESTSGGVDANPEIVAWVTASTLTFDSRYYTSGTRQVYFVLYRDYGDTA